METTFSNTHYSIVSEVTLINFTILDYTELVAVLVRRLYIVFDNEEFEELKRIKEGLGLSWPEVIRKGLECLREREKL